MIRGSKAKHKALVPLSQVKPVVPAANVRRGKSVVHDRKHCPDPVLSSPAVQPRPPKRYIPYKPLSSRLLQKLDDMQGQVSMFREYVQAQSLKQSRIHPPSLANRSPELSRRYENSERSDGLPLVKHRAEGTTHSSE
jgi:hypothetical protein